ncbi:MAG: hypothetical protein IJN11_02635 [Oscillospiraceae bacterium]|nr:hypothetical protein [Oscillospiraceae bacterium]MBQ7012797.1 hypothetical protein [Oscillospiraceae bacterium]
MEKFVPYEKMSKKAKKELDARRRGDWGLCHPASRQEENRKAYRRHEKHKKSALEE